MIRLVRVELTRLRWRRAVVVLLAACFLVPAAVWASTVYDSRPVSPEELADARQMVSHDKYFDREVTRCAKHPGRWGLQDRDSAELARTCETRVLGSFVGFREPLDLRDQLDLSGPGMLLVMAVLLVLVGATFVGADWSSGSMSNQLLFESRRSRVFAAKGLAVLLVGLAVTAVVAAAWWLGLGAVVHQRDLPVTDGTWPEIGWQVLRGAAFAGGAGVGGYALTMLFRSTVATLGVLFGTSVAGGILFGTLPIAGAERWSPATNVAAWIQDGTTYYDESRVVDCDPDHFTPAACDGSVTLTMWAGGTYLLVLLAVVLLLALLAFRRRDVP